MDITGPSCCTRFRSDLGKASAVNKPWTGSQQAPVLALAWPLLCYVTLAKTLRLSGPSLPSCSMDPGGCCELRASRNPRESIDYVLWPQDGCAFVLKRPNVPFVELLTLQAHSAVQPESERWGASFRQEDFQRFPGGGGL